MSFAEIPSDIKAIIFSQSGLLGENEIFSKDEVTKGYIHKGTVFLEKVKPLLGFNLTKVHIDTSLDRIRIKVFEDYYKFTAEVIEKIEKELDMKRLSWAIGLPFEDKDGYEYIFVK
jgi:hypothetical protein